METPHAGLELNLGRSSQLTPFSVRQSHEPPARIIMFGKTSHAIGANAYLLELRQPCRCSRVSLWQITALYRKNKRALIQQQEGSCCDGGGGNKGGRPLIPTPDDGEEDNTHDHSCRTNFWSGWHFLQIVLLGGTMTMAQPAQAGLGRPSKASKKYPQETDRLVDLGWPIAKNLGFSGVLGAITAICFKTAGRSLAVVVGAIFAVIQVGAYMGYVTVDWARVHKDVIRNLDINNDGKFDATDFKALTASFLAILSQGVPSAGGFCFGFTWGLSL